MGSIKKKLIYWLAQGSEDAYGLDSSANVRKLEKALAQLQEEADVAAQDLSRKEQDLTDRAQLAEKLHAQLQDIRERDPLTGLLLRQPVLKQIRQVLAQEVPPKYLCALELRVIPVAGLPLYQAAAPNEAFLTACGEALGKLPRCLLTRREGNIFQGFLYAQVEEVLQKDLQRLQAKLEKLTGMLEATGTRTYETVLGTASYPQDSQAPERLLEKAQLAAYTAQQRGCKTLAFSQELAGSILLTGAKPFRELIEKNQLDFLLQPIARSRDGKIHGYEIVPQSRNPELGDMGQVLAVADYLGRRQELEDRILFGSMTRIRELVLQGRLLFNERIWLRSLDGTCLSDARAQAFGETFFDDLPQILLEIPVSRPEGALYAAAKNQWAKQWGIRRGVSCRGLDREDVLKLTFLEPDVIRAEASLVQGIANDEKKQTAFTALRRYATDHGCTILAEGIENSADLTKVIRLGADYLQGDCLGRPDPFPTEIPEKRVMQIGEARYKRKG